MDRLTEEELERKVYDLLKGRRYLVVLDDTWEKVAWNSLKNALPNTGSRSRVLLTTRNKEVALKADVLTLPHELRCLNKEESWKLFCRKAFPENTTPSCPPCLEKFGRAMVDRCDGLPLALLVLGGMLLTKNQSPHEWERMLNNIHWYLNESEDGSNISGILGLSYNDLPYHLKSCFMHVGLFREDYHIFVSTLFDYWIVEGILPQQGEETTEGVAENCLNELINRSLIQVVERKADGRAHTCRIHDLLRDLSVTKAKEENFLLEITNRDLNYEALPKSSRRFVVHSKSEFDSYYAAVSSLQQQSTLHLRTLMFIYNAYDMSLCKKHMEFICRRFKLLRVLDLIGTKIICLPRAVGNLIHLKYLSIEASEMESQIPSSIGNLQNLQHLLIRQFSSKYMKIKLPNVIWKLKRLRHLDIIGDWITSHLRIDTLRNLQSLSGIDATVWIRGGNGFWTNLTYLVHLKIIGITRSNVEVLFNSFNQLNHLNFLWLNFETIPTLAPLAFCPRLHEMFLCGPIEKLPDPHEFPPNLTMLQLHDSILKPDSILILGKLPNLKRLRLYGKSYMEEELVMVANGFPQLQVLQISGLENLEEWRVEEGALIMLRHLSISNCTRLRMVPEGLRLMTNLKEMEIIAMPPEFNDRLRGEDQYKVQHIPSITIKRGYL